MEAFTSQHPTEPKGRAGSGFSIRSLKSWDGVSGQLEKARELYEDTRGISGGIKKGIRKVTGKAHMLQGVVEMVPEIEYVSPVLAVLKVLLKVRFRTGAELVARLRKSSREPG
jgi:hypothetical protein